MAKLRMLTIFPSFRCSKVSELLFGLRQFVRSPGTGFICEREGSRYEKMFSCTRSFMLASISLPLAPFSKEGRVEERQKEINEIYGGSVLTMLHEECRQTCCTANNHRNTQNPSPSKIAEAWPKENVSWQFASPGHEEIKNFVSTFKRARRRSL
jgi:hypothetical protein